jgi:hypothetical protein
MRLPILFLAWFSTIEESSASTTHHWRWNLLEASCTSRCPEVIIQEIKCGCSSCDNKVSRRIGVVRNDHLGIGTMITKRKMKTVPEENSYNEKAVLKEK